MQLTIYRGLPGSGKTTLALKQHPQVFHLENDMLLMDNGQYKWTKARQKKAVAWCQEMARTALENGMDVVVSNVFSRRDYIQPYAKMASDFSAAFRVVRCTGKWKNVHDVPASTLAAMASGFEDWPGEEIA